MIANWLEKTLVLTPEKESDFVSLNVLAAACNPRNWSHTPPQGTTSANGDATAQVTVGAAA